MPSGVRVTAGFHAVSGRNAHLFRLEHGQPDQRPQMDQLESCGRLMPPADTPCHRQLLEVGWKASRRGERPDTRGD